LFVQLVFYLQVVLILLTNDLSVGKVRKYIVLYALSTLSFFIAFDLLRVCVHGILGFTNYFFQEYPDYFISPVRLSGSAVETLFSQFKHTSGGKLSSANYSTARAAHLVKHTVSYHDGSKGYRDVPLH